MMRPRPMLALGTALALAIVASVAGLAAIDERNRYNALAERVGRNTEMLVAGQADRYTGAHARADLAASDLRLKALENRVARLEERQARFERERPK